MGRWLSGLSTGLLNLGAWFNSRTTRQSKEKLKPEVLEYRFSYNISGLIYPGVLELGYIAVLEAAAERIKGSTPFAWTTSVIYSEHMRR